MKFETYLAHRHKFITGYKGMQQVSAKQYANRLYNLVNKGIYNEEHEINHMIVNKINEEYANKANEYVRTLKYYLEYRQHMESCNSTYKTDLI